MQSLFIVVITVFVLEAGELQFQAVQNHGFLTLVSLPRAEHVKQMASAEK